MFLPKLLKEFAAAFGTWKICNTPDLCSWLQSYWNSGEAGDQIYLQGFAVNFVEAWEQIFHQIASAAFDNKDLMKGWDVVGKPIAQRKSLLLLYAALGLSIMS